MVNVARKDIIPTDRGKGNESPLNMPLYASVTL
jgi:hypothetical protein